MGWIVALLLVLIGFLLWGRWRRNRQFKWQMPEERRRSEERKQFKDKEDALHAKQEQHKRDKWKS